MSRVRTFEASVWGLGLRGNHAVRDAATEARRVDGVERPKFDFHTGLGAAQTAAPAATNTNEKTRADDSLLPKA